MIYIKEYENFLNESFNLFIPTDIEGFKKFCINSIKKFIKYNKIVVASNGYKSLPSNMRLSKTLSNTTTEESIDFIVTQYCSYNRIKKSKEEAFCQYLKVRFSCLDKRYASSNNAVEGYPQIYEFITETDKFHLLNYEDVSIKFSTEQYFLDEIKKVVKQLRIQSIIKDFQSQKKLYTTASEEDKKTIENLLYTIFESDTKDIDKSDYDIDDIDDYNRYLDDSDFYSITPYNNVTYLDYKDFHHHTLANFLSKIKAIRNTQELIVQLQNLRGGKEDKSTFNYQTVLQKLKSSKTSFVVYENKETEVIVSCIRDYNLNLELIKSTEWCTKKLKKFEEYQLHPRVKFTIFSFNDVDRQDEYTDTSIWSINFVDNSLKTVVEHDGIVDRENDSRNKGLTNVKELNFIEMYFDEYEIPMKILEPSKELLEFLDKTKNV